GFGMAFLELSLISDAKDGCTETEFFSTCNLGPEAGMGLIVALLAANALVALALFRNPTRRSFVLCFVLGLIGAGIEAVLRSLPDRGGHRGGAADAGAKGAVRGVRHLASMRGVADSGPHPPVCGGYR